MDFPDKVGLMQLPNAVFFPHTFLPLHIFETRYRELLEDALQGNRIFGVVFMPKPKGIQELQSARIAGVGLIRAAVTNADGTSNLVLQGIKRVRIVRYLRERSYPYAEVEPMDTVYHDSVEIDALSARLQELFKKRKEMGSFMPEYLENSLETSADPDLVSDVIASHLPVSMEHKQEILDAVDLRLRLKRLIAILQNDMTSL